MRDQGAKQQSKRRIPGRSAGAPCTACRPCPPPRRPEGPARRGTRGPLRRPCAVEDKDCMLEVLNRCDRMNGYFMTDPRNSEVLPIENWKC